MQRPEQHIEITLHLIILRQGSLAELEANISARLSGQRITEITCLHSPMPGFRHVHSCLVSGIALGIQTLALMYAQQVLLSTDPSPQTQMLNI